MSLDNKQKIYSDLHSSFIDKITQNKRMEILKVISNYLKNDVLQDVLDIGTTQDIESSASNYIIKNLKGFKIYKSISDQEINTSFFAKKLKKSITVDFSKSELDEFKSDLVISNATIEHVGSFENQIKMCSNIMSLSKKYFIIMTPNRFHPLEFHTKIPIIHWLPKKFYRMILRFFGLKFFANEKNLNLLSEFDLRSIMKKNNQINYEIKFINFFFIKSNLILIGEKN